MVRSRVGTSVPSTIKTVPLANRLRGRGELDDRLPHQGGYEVVELHLVPAGDDARLQVSELVGLKKSSPITAAGMASSLQPRLSRRSLTAPRPSCSAGNPVRSRDWR
jgi:hypothetical protein